jgi:hypothetical protein
MQTGSANSSEMNTFNSSSNGAITSSRPIPQPPLPLPQIQKQQLKQHRRIFKVIVIGDANVGNEWFKYLYAKCILGNFKKCHNVYCRHTNR